MVATLCLALEKKPINSETADYHTKKNVFRIKHLISLLKMYFKTKIMYHFRQIFGLAFVKKWGTHVFVYFILDMSTCFC